MTATLPVRSPAWSALPLAARGLVADLLAALGDQPELPLGPLGLRALAAFLGATWDELEPLLAVVLGAGVFVRYDADRQVVTDARRGVSGFSPRREALASSEPAPVPSAPPPSAEPTRAALRARAWRATRKAAAAALAAAQIPLFAGEAFANAPNAYANGANALEGVRCGNLERSSAFANAPLSLSISSNSSKKKRETAVRVTLVPDAAPPGWLEHARELRPDLPVAAVARSWRRFALEKTGSLPSLTVVQARWESWIERERTPTASTTDAPPPPASAASPKASADEPRPAPYHRPATPPRPDHESAPPSSARPIVRRAAPVDPAVLAAAARLAAGDFSAASSRAS